MAQRSPSKEPYSGSAYRNVDQLNFPSGKKPLHLQGHIVGAGVKVDGDCNIA